MLAALLLTAEGTTEVIDVAVLARHAVAHERARDCADGNADRTANNTADHAARHSTREGATRFSASRNSGRYGRE